MTRSGVGNEARALRVMVEELRAEEPPALDWDAMERRLMVGIDHDGGAAPKPPKTGSLLDRVAEPERWFVRPPFGRMLAAAAAVLCLVGGAAALHGAGSTVAPVASRQIDASAVALASGEAGIHGVHDVLALAPGDAIEAGDAPITFNAKGVVSWTLAPGSRAVVRSIGVAGVGHTVALERGSIHAEVVPRDASTEGLVEAFAVEVDRTRVAVHGTSFTVKREADSVEVEVEHGAVAVGPAGRGGITTGSMLVGHARASFSLDGAKTGRFLPLETAAAATAVEASASPPVGASVVAFGGSRSPAPAVESAHDSVAALGRHPHAEAITGGSRAREIGAAADQPAPSAPTAARVTVMTPATVSSDLSACFARSFHESSSSVRVTVVSSLRLTLDDSGNVRAAIFDPPIAPNLLGCAAFTLGGHFGTGGREVTIPVNFQPR